MGETTTALVLGAGAARGAYEAGVVSYLRDELPARLGRPLRLDVLTGSSVGAIGACFLAATADRPDEQGRGLVDLWRSLRIEDVLPFGAQDALRLILGRPAPAGPSRRPGVTASLIDPRGLEALLLKRVPWRRIAANLKAGHLDALAVSATRVGTGRTTFFVQKRGGGLPAMSRDTDMPAVEARIGPRHALASAAIPLLFPAVPIDGALYVDGGLRLNVPLRPALRLGARKVIVVSLIPKPCDGALADRDREREQEASMRTLFTAATSLVGKTFNALLADRTDRDLDRLDRLNAVLTAGTRVDGPGFGKRLNDSLVAMGERPFHPVRTLVVHPACDTAQLAADYARSAAFRKRSRGLAAFLLRVLADREAPHQADLLSYLLFDGGFADLLIEQGRADARALGDEWLSFASDVATPQPGAAAGA